MREFDASSLMHGWDTYPVGQFPSMWAWLSGEFTAGRVSICKVAYDEVKREYPDCAAWLDKIPVKPTAITGAMLDHSQWLKHELGIEEEQYSTRGGVGENELFIIASAHVNASVLVSNEAVQTKPPDKLKNCKVPAVCAMQRVGVECISFLELITDSGIVFEGL